MTLLNKTISATVKIILVFITIFEIVIHIINCLFVNNSQTNFANDFHKLINLSAKVFDEVEFIDFHKSKISNTFETENKLSIENNFTMNDNNVVTAMTAIIIIIEINTTIIFLNYEDLCYDFDFLIINFFNF